MGKRRPLIDQILEIIENSIRRTVEIRIDLLGHNLLLTPDLSLRKHRITHHLPQQRHSPLEMSRRKSRIDNRLLLRRISIQLTTDNLHTVPDIRRPVDRRTLENRMLHEMRQPVQPLRLIAATRIHRHTAMLHSHRHTSRDNPQPVTEPVILNRLFTHIFL
nr:hypothetical protein [Duncaniella sp.]